MTRNVTNYDAGKEAAGDLTGRSMESMLEGMVDRVGVAMVLNTLAGIAYSKAAHVSEAWQDAPLSRRWEQMARALEKTEALADKIGTF